MAFWTPPHARRNGAECVLATAGLTQIRDPHSLYFPVPAAWDYPYASMCSDTLQPG